MPDEMRVPPFGESVTEAVVGRWLKAEGDSFGPDEAIVELETDKVALEVTAEQAGVAEPGVLERIVQPEGATVNVGDVLATVAVGAGNGATAPAAPAATSAPSVAAEAPASSASNGAIGAIGAMAAAPATPGSAAAGPTQGLPAAAPAAEDALVTPVARRLASEHGVDLAALRGSGAGGRITQEDVLAYINRAPGPAPAVQQPTPQQASEQPAAPASSAASGTPATMPAQTAPVAPAAGGPLPAPLAALFAPPEREERVRMSRRRQTIARRLVEAQHTAAMLTTFNEVDMSAVMEVRRRRRDSFKERHGVGLGFMSFFTKATVGALKAFPRLNAAIQGDELILKHHYDIGVAVGAEEGLVVPVLRDADHKSFAAIEREIAALATRARENKLTLAELQGGTFTITNGGIFGSLLSTPILNAPEVGILGMHKIEERPVAVKGEVVIRPMMYLALSYDHRIVDGREAVQFLVRIKELIEDPETLLLEG